MTRLVLATGLRRSGLHLCVNALAAHFPGVVQLINDPYLDARDPEDRAFYYRQGAGSLEELPGRGALLKDLRRLNHQIASGLPRPWSGLARRLLGRFWVPAMERGGFLPTMPGLVPEDVRTRIVLIENPELPRFGPALDAWLKRHRFEDAQPGPRVVWLILRSPWNCLASNLKRPQPWPPRGIPEDQIVEEWKTLAREALGRTRLLTAHGLEPRPLLYERYLDTEACREELAARLGHPAPPLATVTAKVASFGGGSSFASAKERAAPDAEALGKRWLHYAKHPLMRRLFADGEARELCTALGYEWPAPPLENGR